MLCSSQADVQHWRQWGLSERYLVVQLLTVERLEGGGYSTGDWRGRPDEEIVAPGKRVKTSCHGPDRR